MKNFASAAIKKNKVQGKHEKVLELKTTRDLLGRLVYLACTRKIDLEKVFPFPLTPVPFSLASIYGMVKKTPKYKLSKHLEHLITHKQPSAVDVVLYDAMLIIQSLPSDLPLRFGNIAELVLRIICSTQAREVHFVCDSYVKSIKNIAELVLRIICSTQAREVHFVCDSYVKSIKNIAELVLRIICSTQAREVHFVCDSYVKSIKNIEQQARGVSDGQFHITGADQLRPKDFRHALRSPNFKTAFL